MRASVASLCCFALLSAPSWAAADVYRYTDREGVEHYTNVQPRGRGWRRLFRTDDRDPDEGPPAAGRRSEQRRTDPERLQRYDAHIREAAQLYQLPVAFIRAIVLVESNFYADAISVDGAMGLMQLMPQTAAKMGVLDAFDPRQNVLGGARYLRVLANRYNGDLVLTVAAYNAGEAAVDKYRGVPPYAETRRYVQRVLKHYYAFRNMGQLLAKR